MPASTQPSPSRGARAIGPRRALRGDSHGVSEVVGFLLIFGVLSMVLLLSMVAFNLAKDAAKDNAVELRAESAAARVAAVVVQTAVLAEQESASSPAIAYRIDLPEQLEGYDYRVYLEPAGQPTACGDAGDLAASDQVCVTVPALRIGPNGQGVTAPLFSASAPVHVRFCTIGVPGGPLDVRYDSLGKPAACTAAASELFLSEASA